MCRHTRGPVIYSKFHRNPFRGFGAPGVKIWPFPLLWLVAFTTACTTVQAVITDQVSEAINNMKFTLGVFIDLSRFFDTYD